MRTSFVMLVFLMYQEKSLLILSFCNTEKQYISFNSIIFLSRIGGHTLFSFSAVRTGLMNVNEFGVLNPLQELSRLC